MDMSILSPSLIINNSNNPNKSIKVKVYNVEDTVTILKSLIITPKVELQQFDPNLYKLKKRKLHLLTNRLKEIDKNIKATLCLDDTKQIHIPEGKSVKRIEVSNRICLSLTTNKNQTTEISRKTELIFKEGNCTQLIENIESQAADIFNEFRENGCRINISFADKGTQTGRGRCVSTATSARRAVNNLQKYYSYSLKLLNNWISKKNKSIRKRKEKFKRNILKMLREDICTMLVNFVQELQESPPDYLYYVCLNLQMYLHSNKKCEYFFHDHSYEKFVEYVDTVVQRFPSPTIVQYIETRVEEDLLWKAQELGIKGPGVLVNTLVFILTKYLNLTTVEEHMQVTFDCVYVLSKANGSKEIHLYIPNIKVIFKQDEINPDRAPFNILNFYLSKCPECVKGQKQLLYLEPKNFFDEVWFTETSVNRQFLQMLINRFRMVKEIGIVMMKNN